MDTFVSDYLSGRTIPTAFRRLAVPQLVISPEERRWENERQRAGAYTFGELPAPIPEYSSDVASGYVPYPQESALTAAEQLLFTPDPEGETTRTFIPASSGSSKQATISRRVPNTIYENGKPLPKEKSSSFNLGEFFSNNPYAALSALALLIGGGALALRK